MFRSRRVFHSEVPHFYHTMKILIVDDYVDMRRLLHMIVSGRSVDPVEIIECATGVEAVEQYAVHHPDYVLLDVQLKDINGFIVAENIYKADPDAKIIFVTSFNTPAFRAKAEQLHAKGFVSKDNLSELKQLIQPILPGGDGLT